MYMYNWILLRAPYIYSMVRCSFNGTIECEKKHKKKLQSDLSSADTAGELDRLEFLFTSCTVKYPCCRIPIWAHGKKAWNASNKKNPEIALISSTRATLDYPAPQGSDIDQRRPDGRRPAIWLPHWWILGGIFVDGWITETSLGLQHEKAPNIYPHWPIRRSHERPHDIPGVLLVWQYPSILGSRLNHSTPPASSLSTVQSRIGMGTVFATAMQMWVGEFQGSFILMQFTKVALVCFLISRH